MEVSDVGQREDDAWARHHLRFRTTAPHHSRYWIAAVSWSGLARPGWRSGRGIGVAYTQIAVEPDYTLRIAPMRLELAPGKVIETFHITAPCRSGAAPSRRPPSQHPPISIASDLGSEGLADRRHCFAYPIRRPRTLRRDASCSRRRRAEVGGGRRRNGAQEAAGRPPVSVCRLAAAKPVPIKPPAAIKARERC
jgi:hypothetical protein